MAGAAFFDLDKTLMAGSSGMVFARVANQRGFVPRRQLARWGWDHLRYRLRGSSDEQTSAVIDVAKKVCPNGPPCPAHVDGVEPRKLDGAHFDPASSVWLARWMLPRILSAVSRG